MPRQNQVATLVVWLGLLAGDCGAEPHVAGADRFPKLRGQQLYTELGCAGCHGDASRAAPVLTDLRKRINHDWLVEFLEQPEPHRMPALFDSIAEDERPGAIRDVAAWLGTLRGKLKLPKPRHANAERGSVLYREIGCMACHAEGGAALPDLAKKTSLAPLAHFLSNTLEYRKLGQMPQIRLEPQEAIDIAAHLLDFQGSDPREATPVKPWPKAGAESIARGKQLATSLNCAACHELPDIERKTVGEIKDPAGHCLTDAGPARYGLSKSQREAIIAYLRDPEPAFPDGLEVAHRVMLARWNCYSCHERNGHGGPTAATDRFFIGDPSLGDAGRLPPPLTGVGGKLKPESIEAALLAKPSSRVRPYLKTRMPQYPLIIAKMMASDWGPFAPDFPRLDGPHPPVPPEKIDDLEAGRKLLGTNGGANCITCHRWGDRPSLGIQGLDLSDLDKRMDPAWFRKYLLDPAGYRPGTLMPAFWPGGHSSIKDVLGGDTEKQIGAIWAFIRDGEGLPEGFPETGAGQFELVAKDRPIIQRTFLEGVGTHAILVGFPGGINLAYDGASGQPRLVWRGRFFDAYNTWFSRFAPYEKPLEKKIYRFGKGLDERRFLGYDLDPVGNPSFLARIGDSVLEEHFAVSDGKLVRTLHAGDQLPFKFNNLEGVNQEVDLNVAPGTVVITYSWK